MASGVVQACRFCRRSVPATAGGLAHLRQRLVDGEAGRLLARREVLEVAANSAAIVCAAKTK
jgi:hypothetical protein